MGMLDVRTAEAVVLLNRLRGLGVAGVDTFENKLSDNAGDAPRIVDLMSEGYAAATFTEAAFEVAMADAPDLWLTHHGVRVGAEVKHFRLKEQDRVDEIRLANASNGEWLEAYGNARESGEAWCGWEQVFKRADRAARTIKLSHPFIVVIHSDSDYCIEECEVKSAFNEIEDRVNRGWDSDAHLSGISGLLFMGNSTRLSDLRNTHFFEAPFGAHPLPDEVASAIGTIRRWRRSVPPTI